MTTHEPFSLIELPHLEHTIPHMDQWMGVWAMHQPQFDSLLQMILATDLNSHLQAIHQHGLPQPQASSGGGDSQWYYRQDREGVAVIAMNGPLQKHRQSMSSATSTVIARRELRQAANDPNIGAILLAIDSPGGTAAGTAEIANDVANIGLQKPVHVYGNDLVASAAYWVGAQGTVFTANEAAFIGSIGTYSVAVDASGAAAQKGLSVHVVRAGQFKGMGTPGTQITPEQLQQVQRMVDSYNSMFLSGVQAGRHLDADTVAELADGRIHNAKEAKKLKLIDGIESFDSAFRNAAKAARGGSKPQVKGSGRMTTSIAEIKAACPNASAEFLVSALEGGKDLDSIRSLYMSDMQSKLEVANKAAADATAELVTVKAELESTKAELASEKAKAQATTAKAATGTEGIPAAGPSTGASSAGGYWEAVKSHQTAGLSRAEAMNKVNKEQPELRAEMLASVNK